MKMEEFKSPQSNLTLVDISQDTLVTTPQAQLAQNQTSSTPVGDPNKKIFRSRTSIRLRRKSLATPSSQRKPSTFAKAINILHAPRKNLTEIIQNLRTTTKSITKKKNLRKGRPIIIDGSNIAMSYGQETTGKPCFHCKGIKKCVNILKNQSPFKDNKHKIIVIVPKFRLTARKTIDAKILHKLIKKRICKLTPSGTVNGKFFSCYDDNYIVRYAHDEGGIIVSNDQFRDVKETNPEWTETIDTRRLSFDWFGKKLMFPNDPMGKFGPLLAEFICF